MDTVKPVKIDKTKVFMENGSLMKVEYIAECSAWPALSDNWYWKPIYSVLYEWPLKTGFTVHVEWRKQVTTWSKFLEINQMFSTKFFFKYKAPSNG